MVASLRTRLGITAAVVGISLAVAGCSSSTTATSDTSATSTATSAAVATIPADQLTAAGKLTVCGGVGAVPYAMYKDGTTDLEGIDVDLAKAIASDLGLTANIVNTPFDTIIEALQSHKCDVIMSTQDVTAARQAVINQITYLTVPTGILVQDGNPKNIGDPATDVSSLCGTSFAVALGSSSVDMVNGYSDECVAKGLDKISVTTAPDNNALLLLLTTKKVDAFVGTSATAGYISKSQPGTITQGAILDKSVEGIGVAKDRTETLDAVLKALDTINTDGTFAKILETYGETAADSIPSNIGDH